MESRTLYGQAYIFEDKLIQDQILVLENGNISEAQVAIINNIWDNLLSGNDAEFPVKGNGKFFYWEVKMTNPTDDSVEEIIKIECPRPSSDILDRLSTGTSIWAQYWAAEYQKVLESNPTIQKTEFVLLGEKSFDFSTETWKEPTEIISKNNDLGDITNLLDILF